MFLTNKGGTIVSDDEVLTKAATNPEMEILFERAGVNEIVKETKGKAIRDRIESSD